MSALWETYNVKIYMGFYYRDGLLLNIYDA
mgnify:CR=1 FL=1